MEIQKDQLISLTKENLVNVFLFNALKSKDEEAIQNILNILHYGYSDDTKWIDDALRFALKYSNYELAIKLFKHHQKQKDK